MLYTHDATGADHDVFMPSRTVFYGTYKCFGPGANTSTWPAWAHRLTTKEVAPFLDYDTFIDADEWLPRSK